MLSGVRRYSWHFVAEVICYACVLVIFQVLDKGKEHSLKEGLLALAMITLAMGAAEARFKLYRRVWAVAGIHDALAIGFAVAEASTLLTLANLAIPATHRPFSLSVPILAGPASPR